ncbi:cytochrome P450 [Rhypophila decipiens]
MGVLEISPFVLHGIKVDNARDVLALLLKAFGGIVLVGLLKFFYHLHTTRMRVRRDAKEHGIPMLPHYYLFGHLPHLVKVFIKGGYPPDVNGQCVGYLLAKQYPDMAKEGIVYFDTWPIIKPIAWVVHPDMMSQCTQVHSLPKEDFVRREFHHMTEGQDLLTSDGRYWKQWRAIFNPGFATKNLLSLVPTFFEEICVFTDQLRKQAETGEVGIFLDPVMNLTYDIIGRAVLDERLHCQTTANRFKWAMNKQTEWVIQDNSLSTILKLLNPFRSLMTTYYNKVMTDSLLPSINRAIKEHLTGESANKPKTINSLAIKSYLSQAGIDQSDVSPDKVPKLDSSFTRRLINHIKMFMLAGHDTTASTLAFAFIELERNPHVLAKLRQEHDAVFGTDLSTVESQVSESPHLLNALPYTLAVLKETLRLYAPVGSFRGGEKGFFLVHPETRKKYPTEGWAVFNVSWWSHRDPRWWPRAEEFLPERFLAKEGEELYVGKNLFRPFELGPRGCIGQELSLLEMKAILIMMVREMDISMAYEENDPEFLGCKGYQVMEPGQVAGRPRKGMPFRVRLAGDRKG